MTKIEANKTDFKVIVCAAIQNHTGKVLIARRKQNKILGGLWEFPGGKLEHGEELIPALKREIFEELQITIRVDKLLHIKPFVYNHGAVLIIFYLCQLEAGEIKLQDHDEYKWSTLVDLKGLKLLPANEELVESLKKINSIPND